MREVLKAEGLTVGYEEHVVVKDISFALEPGKVLTLIGPNGSGKSTVLKSLAKQLKMLGGIVYFDGISMKNMKEGEIAGQVSLVMTERIHPEMMSCRDVVATGRYPYTGRFGMLSKEDWNQVEYAMALVRADEVAEQDFLKISDGQKQRVMLARAICQNTPIMILDEPTSYLDMRYKLEILEHIRRLAAERQITVVMSLHELDLVQKVSDYVACVERDRIGKIAPPEEIFQGDYIQTLYGVPRESFNPVLGTMYLRANQSSPRYFVIGGGGKGIPVYQKLQRRNIPFAVGILGKNDIDYAIAAATASQVVCTEAFYPIEEGQLAQGRQLIDQCEGCICALTEFGPQNLKNEILRDYAQACGKLVSEIEAR